MKLTHDDHKRATIAEETRCIIEKNEAGWVATRGGKVIGVSLTREGAKELLGAL